MTAAGWLRVNGIQRDYCVVAPGVNIPGVTSRQRGRVKGMSTVLVLGGTSWLGGQIALHAVTRGHDVTCLARGESGEAPAAATFVRGDRDDPGAYERVRDERWDMVIDVSRQPGQVRSAVEVLGGTASHWTFVSTGSVYADQSGPLTEVSPLLDPLDG